jgi:hypothetical protein
MISCYVNTRLVSFNNTDDDKKSLIGSSLWFFQWIDNFLGWIFYALGMSHVKQIIKQENYPCKLEPM